MSNQTEREKFIDAMRKTLTLLSREDAAYWWDMRDRSALAWQARAALDGGAVSGDICSHYRGSGIEEVYGGHGSVKEIPCGYCQPAKRQFSERDLIALAESILEDTQADIKVGESISSTARKHVAALRIQQPAPQDEARDVRLVRAGAAWFNRSLTDREAQYIARCVLAAEKEKRE